ncbi:MAG: hypothetical protein C0593_09840 [Marinilabiliales bacterium]|nr:MAG: hypothetical protein C0593_09840 [Marinilabiliales bacterium]
MSESIFKIVFNTWFDAIRSYLLYRCGDEELATDITQEAFLKLWTKRLYQNPESIPAIIYKIASDLLVSHFRKQNSENKYRLSLQPEAVTLTPEEELNYHELNRKYEIALSKLPENQRTVFLMSRMESLKYQEIAARLGISVKAVEKRMSSALSTLRNVLQP